MTSLRALSPIRWVAIVLLMGTVVVLSPSCSKKCDDKSCTGCCNAKNECATGNEVNACGVSGQSCGVCTEGQTCETGSCQTAVVDSGEDAGDSGEVDAGPPPCTKDDDCTARHLGQRCEVPTGTCVDAKKCNSDPDCQEAFDPLDYCYQYGVQCRCETADRAPDSGFVGTCKRRHGPCEECTTDTECGSGNVFDPQGACKQLMGDTSGKKYCLQKHPSGPCPCGMTDDLTGYCKPQNNSCEQVGCSNDKDCPSGSICNSTVCGICEPRCRWDFTKKQLVAPGCPPGKTCWVDQKNLEPTSLFFGAGRCKSPCTNDTDCTNTGSNPFGGNKLRCAGEALSGGGTSAKRCRGNGQCMDEAECPVQPSTSVYFGYCDRTALSCATDCRTGNDPVTGKPYQDCRTPYACADDAGTRYCRLRTCVEQGGAVLACHRGQFCCGEDKNGDTFADPCPSANELGPDNCYDVPVPPFCTTCTSNNDCENVQLPSWLSGAGACSNGSKSPSCSTLPMECLYAGDRAPMVQGVSICAPATFNNSAQDTRGVGADVRGCPAGYRITPIFIDVDGDNMNADNCSSDDDCNIGIDAGRCGDNQFGNTRLPDGGTRPIKSCLCKVGTPNGCPNDPDAGVKSQCKFGITGQTMPCVESVVCFPPGNTVYQDAGSPNFGCGL